MVVNSDEGDYGDSHYDVNIKMMIMLSLMM